MKVSKEKAIATFAYPYQSYGISFALDEINYEELYKTFVRYCSRYDGLAFSVLSKDSSIAAYTENKDLVRSQIDLIFNKVLALDSDVEGFWEYGTVKSENEISVDVSFSKISDRNFRVSKPNPYVAPLIFFEFKLAVLGKERQEACFTMTVTKEKDLKHGLPDWR